MAQTFKCSHDGCTNKTNSVTGECKDHRQTVCTKCRRVFTRTKIGQTVCTKSPCWQRKLKDYSTIGWRPIFLLLFFLVSCGPDKPQDTCELVDQSTNTWQCTYSDGLVCTFRIEGQTWVPIGCRKP